MNNKEIVIEQKVPTCPVCSALMWKRYQGKDLFFVCNDDISHIYKTIKIGQTENELLVTDNEVANERKALKSSNWFSKFPTFFCDIFREKLSAKANNKYLFEFSKPNEKNPKYFICTGGRGK